MILDPFSLVLMAQMYYTAFFMSVGFTTEGSFDEKSVIP